MAAELRPVSARQLVSSRKIATVRMTPPHDDLGHSQTAGINVVASGSLAAAHEVHQMISWIYAPGYSRDVRPPSDRTRTHCSYDSATA